MTTIAFASWKGGTGKTTLAFNITERANADGVRTLLCDFDPQATALRQHQLRQNHSPDRTLVTTVKASMSDEGLAALRGVQEKDRYDLIICDMPGADSFSMDQALNGVIIQGHKASDIHSHPATLSTVKMDLYQVLVGRSTTPFASSRARCGESLSR